MLSAQRVSCHECYIPNASKDPKAASKSYKYYVLKVETQGFRVKASRFDVISPDQIPFDKHKTIEDTAKFEHFELDLDNHHHQNEILIQRYIYNVERWAANLHQLRKMFANFCIWAVSDQVTSSTSEWKTKFGNVVVISLQQKANNWSTLTRCISSTYGKKKRSSHQIQNSRDGRNQILEVWESHVLYKWRVTNHQAVPFLHINPPIVLCVNILKGLIPKPKPVHRICKSFGAILENQDTKSTSNLLLWIKWTLKFWIYIPNDSNWFRTTEYRLSYTQLSGPAYSEDRSKATVTVGNKCTPCPGWYQSHHLITSCLTLTTRLPPFASTATPNQPVVRSCCLTAQQSVRFNGNYSPLPPLSSSLFSFRACMKSPDFWTSPSLVPTSNPTLSNRAS